MFDITMPQGKFVNEELATFTAIVIAADGAEPLEEEPARVWCVVHEVPDCHPGIGASPMTPRGLAERFGVMSGTERWGELRFGQR